MRRTNDVGCNTNVDKDVNNGKHSLGDAYCMEIAIPHGCKCNNTPVEGKHVQFNCRGTTNPVLGSTNPGGFCCIAALLGNIIKAACCPMDNVKAYLKVQVSRW